MGEQFQIEATVGIRARAYRSFQRAADGAVSRRRSLQYMMRCCDVLFAVLLCIIYDSTSNLEQPTETIGKLNLLKGTLCFLRLDFSRTLQPASPFFRIFTNLLTCF